MLSYTLGPFLAFLPRRWRESLPIHESIHWRPAMILSGLLESAIALLALVYWYSYSVTHWAADAVFAAIQHGAEIDPRAIGFAGLAVMWLHPLTWLIAYAGLEGIVRLCAAFTDSTLGVLALFLADKAYLRWLGAKIRGQGFGNVFAKQSGLRHPRGSGKSSDCIAAVDSGRTLRHEEWLGRNSRNPRMSSETRLDSSPSGAPRGPLLPPGNLRRRNRSASVHLHAATIVRRRSRPHRTHLFSRPNSRHRGLLNARPLFSVQESRLPRARGNGRRTVYCWPWRATELQRAGVNPCARSASGCVRSKNQREGEVARLRKKSPPHHRSPHQNKKRRRTDSPGRRRESH